jgi:hypothetical protein
MPPPEQKAQKLKSKNASIFWLKRHIQNLKMQIAPPSQEQMAHEGLTYSQRQMRLGAAEKAAFNAKGQIEALEDALTFLEENG